MDAALENVHEPIVENGIRIEPEVLRLMRYNFGTLYAKIETSQFMCPELQKLLDHCTYLREVTNEGRTSNEQSPLRRAPVRETLFLLEDALDGKLTLAEFESQRQTIIGGAEKSRSVLFKLGLLLVIVGTVLAAAGLFLTYGSVVTVSAVTAKHVLDLGLGSLGGGLLWCLMSRPSQLTRFTADVGPALYYNNAVIVPR